MIFVFPSCKADLATLSSLGRAAAEHLEKVIFAQNRRDGWSWDSHPGPSLYPPIFSAEERIVFAGKNFDRLLARPGLEQFIARANDGNLTFLTILPSHYHNKLTMSADKPEALDFGANFFPTSS
jgi:hypothetical protein